MDTDRHIKITVVIPCYNVGHYLGRCLDSLVNQTMKDIEMICIDDGSTDSTPDILESYRKLDSRIRVLHQPNRKQGAARNNGIRHAEGGFIAFVDADDYVDPDYLEVLYSAAEKNCADIAVCDMLKHKPHGSKYNFRFRKAESATLMRDKLRIIGDASGRFFYAIGKIYRRTLLTDNDISFPEEVYYEDVMFSARTALAAGRIVSVTGTTYHYMKRKGSTVNSGRTEQKERDLVKAYVELADFAMENGFTLPEKTNYAESFWSNPFIKTYRGSYKEKKMLFGLIPVRTENYGQKMLSDP